MYRSRLNPSSLSVFERGHARGVANKAKALFPHPQDFIFPSGPQPFHLVLSSEQAGNQRLFTSETEERLLQGKEREWDSHSLPWPEHRTPKRRERSGSVSLLSLKLELPGTTVPMDGA